MNVGFQRKKDQRGPLLSYVCHRITEIEEDFIIILYFISLRFLSSSMVTAYIPRPNHFRKEWLFCSTDGFSNQF